MASSLDIRLLALRNLGSVASPILIIIECGVAGFLDGIGATTMKQSQLVLPIGFVHVRLYGVWKLRVSLPQEGCPY